ncbi:MAG TPA: hypothetical protein EYP30_08200 [Archaeoglobaceae archaeon]|nr:hypothetical protein [Archaeoglobaceae archaeon]
MEDKENSEEKKIIKVLMDDDKKIGKKVEEKEEEVKEVSEKTEKGEEYLSEIERNVLKVLIMGAKNFHDIFRLTGYPEVIINGAIRRLISKGYVDEDLNPTEKAKYVSFKESVKIVGYRKRVSLIDVGIIIALILLLISILFYAGILS